MPRLSDEDVGLAPASKKRLTDADVGLITADDPGAGKGDNLGQQWRDVGRRALSNPRMTTMAGSAMAGAGAGMLAAGPPGAVVGSILGAGAGSAGYDAAQQFTGPLPDATPMAGGSNAIAGRAAGEMAFESGGQLLGPLAQPVKRFLTPLMGKVLGVRTQEAIQKAAIARHHGVGLGAVDVGNAGARIASRVLGVFPYTGTPFLVARDAKEAQLDAAVRKTLNTMAPTASLSHQMGVDMFEAAKGTHQEFTRLAGLIYDNIRAAGRADPRPLIPTEATRAKAQEWVANILEGQVQVQTGTTQQMRGLEGMETVPTFGTLGTDLTPFERHLFDLANLPPTINYAQFERRVEELEQLVPANADGFTIKRVAQLKEALEQDLNNILDPELKAMKQSADTWFANGIVVFQNPTAKKMGRVEKNIFRPGFKEAGTINEDELFKPVFESTSPMAHRQLRALVGDEVYQRAAGTFLSNAFQESYVPVKRGGEMVHVLNTSKLAAKIGIGPGGKNQRPRLEEMLRGTGTTVRDVEELLTRINILGQGDPSTFIARRVSLGGVRAVSALGGVGTAAKDTAGKAALHTVTGSPLMTLGLTWAARNFGKLIASPEGLRALTRSFSPDVDDVTRRQVLIRLGSAFGDSAFEEPQQ